MKNIIICLGLTLTFTASALADVEIDYGVKEDMSQRQNAGRQKAKDEVQQVEMAESPNMDAAADYEIMTPAQKRAKRAAEFAAAAAPTAVDSSRAARLEAELKYVRETQNHYLLGAEHLGGSSHFQKKFDYLDMKKRHVDALCGPGANPPYNLQPIAADCAEIYSRIEEERKDIEFLTADGELSKVEEVLVGRHRNELESYINSFTHAEGKWASENDPRLVKRTQPVFKSLGTVGKKKDRRPASVRSAE